LNLPNRLHLRGSIVFEPVWSAQHSAIWCRHSQQRLIRTEQIRKAIEYRSGAETMEMRTETCRLNRYDVWLRGSRALPDQRGNLGSLLKDRQFIFHPFG
jgi:hypothetical protein